MCQSMYVTFMDSSLKWPPLRNCQLMLQVRRVTDIKFPLTLSILQQDKRLQELIKWSPMGNCFSWSFNKFSQQILKENIWSLVRRLCMWILGLKGKYCHRLPTVVRFCDMIWCGFEWYSTSSSKYYIICALIFYLSFRNAQMCFQKEEVKP